MTAIARRVHRLEVRAFETRNERGQTMAEVVRERRRLRLEAAGIPFKDRPPGDVPVGCSIGETIRLARSYRCSEHA